MKQRTWEFMNWLDQPITEGIIVRHWIKTQWLRLNARVARARRRDAEAALDEAIWLLQNAKAVERSAEQALANHLDRRLDNAAHSSNAL